jgi:hypothetical protein
VEREFDDFSILLLWCSAGDGRNELTAAANKNRVGWGSKQLSSSQVHEASTHIIAALVVRVEADRRGQRNESIRQDAKVARAMLTTISGTGAPDPDDMYVQGVPTRSGRVRKVRKLTQ